MKLDAVHNIIDNRYRILNRIGAGGMGVVYRVEDRLTNDVIALKMVTVSGEKLDFASKFEGGDYNVALAQEFRTLATVRHPYIISVLDYGFHFEDASRRKRQPYFTMELLQNAKPITEAAKTMVLDQKINLISQTVQALAYLHRRGIIHRDMKPDNVVVIHNDAGEPEVRVLDFGLAIARGEGLEEQAGTLAYMAPELLQGAPASEMSDLFAVGIIAYELLVGNHPYDTANVGELINNMVFGTPDISVLDVDKDLRDLISDLLEKDPLLRLRNAQRAIKTLAAVGGEQVSRETENIRESFLQAARFVGREHEMDLLSTALLRIVRSDPLAVDVPATLMDEEFVYEGEAIGSVWLIGGESGVGKTRLLEELRTHALVEGALVLRGQSVPETSIPYLIWQDVLRQLCLQIDLSPLEVSTLKNIVPDIEQLLHAQMTAKTETTEFMMNQTLLLKTIELIFRRQERPVVVILENLHWAQEDSFQLLRYLTRMIASMRVMIIASFRSDDYPDLPDKLPTAELIELDRLPRETIAALSESMLGEIGRSERVVDMLERETEGNVFFIVEAVRALAEESGELSEVGRKTLPQKIFAEGMKSVVQRRLEAVPEEARPLLYAAAVMGRELDLNLLQSLQSPMDFGDWLFVCEMSIILELREGQWQFVHDKLREGLISELSPEAFKQVHREVAEKLEALYPDDNEQAVRLARLWRSAGDYDRELPYTLLAANQHVRKEDYERALEFYERAMELVQGTGGRPEQVVKVYMGIGTMYRRLQRFSEAEPFLLEALTMAEAHNFKEEQASILHELGALKQEAGIAPAEVLTLWQQELALRRQLDDRAALAVTFKDLGILNIRLDEYDRALSHLKQSLVLAQELQDQALIANIYAGMGHLEQTRGHYQEAQQHYEQCLKLNTTLGRSTAIVQALLGLADVALSMLQIEAATTYVHHALELANSLENARLVIHALESQARVYIESNNLGAAVEYLTFTAAHPRYTSLDEKRRHSLLQSLRARMAPAAYEAAVERGENDALDDLIGAMLGQAPA